MIGDGVGGGRRSIGVVYIVGSGFPVANDGSGGGRRFRRQSPAEIHENGGGGWGKAAYDRWFGGCIYTYEF